MYNITGQNYIFVPLFSFPNAFHINQKIFRVIVTVIQEGSLIYLIYFFQRLIINRLPANSIPNLINTELKKVFYCV